MSSLHELDTPTFRLAVAQFDEAAELMGLDSNLRERLKFPQRSLVVSVWSSFREVLHAARSGHRTVAIISPASSPSR